MEVNKGKIETCSFEMDGKHVDHSFSELCDIQKFIIGI